MKQKMITIPFDLETARKINIGGGNSRSDCDRERTK